MKKISIWKVLRILLLIGCVIGAYAYMASVSDSRQRARDFDEMQRTQNLARLQKAQEQQKERERLEREYMEKADDAEYQLNHWYKVWKDLKVEQESIVPSRASTAQIENMKRKLVEAREKVGIWGKKRMSELEMELAGARDKGQYQLMESINNEVERCRNICDVVGEKMDDIQNNYDNNDVEENADGYLVDGIRYVTENPSQKLIRDWKNRYESLCRSKIRTMMEGSSVPRVMIEEDPCLVYLVLKSKAIKDTGDDEWFDLYEKMNINQKYKLYEVLYREMYKYAQIESDYSY